MMPVSEEWVYYKFRSSSDDYALALLRELENEIRRLALLARTEAIGPECLSAAIREGAAMRPPRGLGPGSEVRPLLEVERQAILHALDRHDGHRGKAAEALGISRSTLYLKLKEIGYE